MADSTRESSAIMNAAGQSLAVQRAGGHHRRKGSAASIGKESARLRQRVWKKRLGYLAGALATIMISMTVAGLVLDGIGFTGVLVVALAVVIASTVFTRFPKVKIPKRIDLTRTQNARDLVGRTELWLESQRLALPPPAVTLVDQIGVQLDALGLQLETVDPAHPAAMEVRKLVGEHLPEMVDSYRKIPAHLRTEERVGSTPDKQLVESLGKISNEIDSVTRQLAEGSLDDLAIRTRYLDYKYGEIDEPAREGN